MNLHIPDHLMEGLRERANACGFENAEAYAIFLIQTELESQLPIHVNAENEERLEKLIQEGIDSGFEPFASADFEVRRTQIERKIAEAETKHK